VWGIAERSEHNAFLLVNVKTNLVLEMLTEIHFLNGNLLKIVDVEVPPL
jgi:hypothetical protein